MRHLRMRVCTALIALSVIGCTCKSPLEPGVADINAGKVLLNVKVKGKSSMAVKETSPFAATANYNDGSSTDVTTLAAWKTNNGACTVSVGGEVTAVLAQECEVSATYTDTTGSSVVAIFDPNKPEGPTSPPTTPEGEAFALSLALSGLRQLSVGQVTPWTAAATMTDGTTKTVTNDSSWSSSQPGIATVNGAGVVTAVAVGMAMITATHHGLSASADVVVSTSPNDEPSVLSISVTGLSNLAIGQSAQWQATANLSDGTTANVTALASWSSGAPTCATVTPTGLVTGVTPGQATITATFKGKVGSRQANVGGSSGKQLIGIEVDADADLTKVKLNTLLQLHVFGVYSDGSKNDVTSAAVINCDDPLLRIDGPGLINVLLTMLAALSNPHHIINVQYGGFSANVNVTIALPVVKTLTIQGSGGIIDLHAGSQLPAVLALFEDGSSVLLPCDFTGLAWNLSARGALPAALALLGVDLGNVLGVNAGVLTSLNNGVVASLFSNALLGGVIPLNVTASWKGVTSNVAQCNVQK